MKIVFICGSIEPGKDGVGDYTRRLAGEIIRQGHKASILSINDKYVTISSEEIHDDSGTKIQTLRLPGNKNYSQKIQSAKEFIDSINPDWLSLQYVPFSFQSKGLHFGLSGILSKIGKGRKWHIMFHELWVLESHYFRVRVLSLVQKWLLKLAIFKLQPESLHTSIKLYQEELIKIKIKADILPLFSNIPICGEPNTRELYLNFKPEKSKQLLYFGAAPGNELTALIVKGIRQYLLVNPDINLKLIIVSFSSPMLVKFCNSLSKELADLKFQFDHFEDMKSQDLSLIMKQINVGIIRSSIDYIGKSGSAVAMLEHGLPLWAPRFNSYNYKNIEEASCFFKNTYNDLSVAIQIPKNAEQFGNLFKIAQLLLGSFRLSN